MENNAYPPHLTAPSPLINIRMSSHDRMIAQRYLDAGVALADLALDLSRRVRIVLRAVGQRLGSGLTH